MATAPITTMESTIMAGYGVACPGEMTAATEVTASAVASSSSPSECSGCECKQACQYQAGNVKLPHNKIPF
jgi:hypothetical protein